MLTLVTHTYLLVKDCVYMESITFVAVYTYQAFTMLPHTIFRLVSGIYLFDYNLFSRNEKN